MARPRSVSDEQILSTVRACALEAGPSVSLDDIAGRLSVTTPALLKRFGNRKSLMVAALRPPSKLPFLDELEAGPSDAPMSRQLERVFELIGDFFMHVFPCMMVLRESGIPESEIWEGRDKPAPREAWQAIAAWLKRARKKGLIEAEELETAASAMFGALMSRIAMSHMLKHPMSSRERRSFGRELATLFCRALQTTERQEKGL